MTKENKFCNSKLRDEASKNKTKWITKIQISQYLKEKNEKQKHILSILNKRSQKGKKLKQKPKKEKTLSRTIYKKKIHSTKLNMFQEPFF